MVRKKPKPQAADRAMFLGLSPNQVVAYNLAQARELKGWTQDQAGEALEPYLGVRWSKASISQAERSVAGGFVRNFTADEIVAFARAFDQPVTWFFMPPPAWAGPGLPTRLQVPDEPMFGEAVALLVDLVFGDELQQAQLALRLDAFLAELGPAGLTRAQGRITALADQRVAALVRHGFSDLSRWQTSLRSLANQLQDLEVRAKLVMANEVGVDVRELRVPADLGPSSEPQDVPAKPTRKRGPAKATGSAPRKPKR